jgi:hypothetical protein
MADTFAKIEHSIKRKSRWRVFWSALLALIASVLALILYSSRH